jgi:hypothetical protein
MKPGAQLLIQGCPREGQECGNWHSDLGDLNMTNLRDQINYVPSSIW